MWAVKLLGCILVICSGGFIGLKAASGLKNRVRILNKLILSIDAISQYIKMGNEEIESILNRTLPSGISYDGTGIIVKNGITLGEEDLSLLKDFYSCLGMGDTETELIRCNSFKALLEKQRSEALTAVEEKYKLFSISGFLCGIILSFLWW